MNHLKKFKKKQLFIIASVIGVLSLSSITPVLAKNLDVKANASIEKRLSYIVEMEGVGNFQSALSAVEKLYTEDNQHLETSISFSRLLLKNNQPQKALEVIQPMVNVAAGDWRVWFWLGSSQLQLADLSNASDSLQSAITINGSEVAIWVQKAIVEQEKGNSNAAMNLLQVANNLSPNNTDVLVNYAYANEKLGNLDKAIQLYQYFLQLSAGEIQKSNLRSQIMLRLVEISNARSLTNDDAVTL